MSGGFGFYAIEQGFAHALSGGCVQMFGQEDMLPIGAKRIAFQGRQKRKSQFLRLVHHTTEEYGVQIVVVTRISGEIRNRCTQWNPVSLDQVIGWSGMADLRFFDGLEPTIAAYHISTSQTFPVAFGDIADIRPSFGC